MSGGRWCRWASFCMGTSPDIDVAFAGDDLVLRLSCAAYLARFSGTSRTHCGWDLRLYFARCVEHHASPLAMNRFQIERYVGWMQEVRRFKPSTIAPDSGCNRLLPHLCHRRCPGALTGRVHAAPASLERVTDVGAFAPAVRSTAERGTGLGQSVRLRARCLFTDRKSGKDTERAELWKCLEYMRAGDTLVVPSLDRLGRPPAMTEEQIRQARAILNRPEETVSSVARLLGVSRSTIYKYVPELAATGHASVDSSAISITT